MALKAILALLLIHILSVAGNGCSSLQENCGSDDDKHMTKLDSSFKSGFTIGFAFSSVSILTIFMSYCVPWTRLKKRKRNKVVMMNPMMTSLMARRERKRKEANIQISKFEKLITRVSFVALDAATGSFDRDHVIGVGKTGTMYKAALAYGGFTAVKRMHNTPRSEKRFRAEVMILGRCKHINLVPLLGICTEQRESILVYKYMPNGNLYDWLHPVKGEAKILHLNLRVKIAVGIARGLAWIHNYNDFQIVHRKISSSCILLDEYFEPKVSNFGRAIKSNVARGFTTYAKVDELDLIKRDVYQFGIILLELITGEDPVNNSKFYRSALELNFVLNEGLSTASSIILYSAVDKSLLGQGFDCQLFSFLKVASTCIQPIPDRRPTMVQVYKMLMGVWNRNGFNTDPEIWGQTDIVSSDSSDDCFELEIAEVKS